MSIENQQPDQENSKRKKAIRLGAIGAFLTVGAVGGIGIAANQSENDIPQQSAAAEQPYKSPAETLRGQAIDFLVSYAEALKSIKDPANVTQEFLEDNGLVKAELSTPVLVGGTPGNVGLPGDDVNVHESTTTDFNLVTTDGDHLTVGVHSSGNVMESGYDQSVNAISISSTSENAITRTISVSGTEISFSQPNNEGVLEFGSVNISGANVVHSGNIPQEIVLNNFKSLIDSTPGL